MTTLQILADMRASVHAIEGVECHMPRPHFKVLRDRRAELLRLLDDLAAEISAQQTRVLVGATIEEVGE